MSSDAPTNEVAHPIDRRPDATLRLEETDAQDDPAPPRPRNVGPVVAFVVVLILVVVAVALHLAGGAPTHGR